MAHLSRLLSVRYLHETLKAWSVRLACGFRRSRMDHCQGLLRHRSRFACPAPPVQLLLHVTYTTVPNGRLTIDEIFSERSKFGHCPVGSVDCFVQCPW
ncbi:hypothetical protein NPIL_165581 [Nephila pilipes]|uniref:Uncharacterized protein n=1 Tax=Nephila pilipes TaxID=299642 RepID=A0A8X6NEW4_NEPPI|nr:hypothetical protein NPIL_165581 [Nephila pilipes]